MAERRVALVGVAALIGAAIAGVLVVGGVQGQKVQEIKFDLGKNIVETARASGVPQFQAQKINNTILYSVTAVPAQLPVRFTRAGYEIVWQPVFGLSMYASEKNNSITHAASLSLDSDITSHESAQAFVEQTVAQFVKGKWQRYFDPEWNVLLTGRSSLLDESGQIRNTLMTIDPAYKISPAEWLQVVSGVAIWRWVGDGVLASLTVGNRPGADGKPDYSMELEFELLDIKLRRDAENLARDLEQGDAKGWNSTAKHEAAKKEARERNKRLAANAVKRGDAVVSIP